jgi:hypothetical protein
MSDLEIIQNLKSQHEEFSKKYGQSNPDGKKLMHELLSKKLKTASIDSRSSSSSASCSFDNVAELANISMIGSFPPGGMGLGNYASKQTSCHEMGQGSGPNNGTSQIRLRRLSSTSLTCPGEGHTSPLAIDSGLIHLKRQNSSTCTISHSGSPAINLLDCEPIHNEIQISLHSPHSPCSLSNRAKSPLTLSSSPSRLHFSFSEKSTLTM